MVFPYISLRKNAEVIPRRNLKRTVAKPFELFSEELNIPDPTLVMRFPGVFAQGLGCRKMQIALHRQAKRAAECFEFGEAHIAVLREAETQVAQSKGDVGVIRTDFGQKPDSGGIRRKELHDGFKVDHPPLFLGDGLLSAVLKHLCTLFIGKKRHDRTPITPVSHGGMASRMLSGMHYPRPEAGERKTRADFSCIKEQNGERGSGLYQRDRGHCGSRRKAGETR